ncbi:MAG: ATP-binding protein [Candidatus Aceula meridiana]|nr:ATP-binding protein [Candidatus Aceula meridiana]
MLKYKYIFFFLAALISLFFNFFVFLKNRKSLINKAFAAFGFSSFLWLFSFAIAYKADNPTIKLQWFNFGYYGIIFMPASFYFFTSVLIGIKRDKILKVFNWTIALIFLIIHVFKKSLILDLYYYDWWGFFPNTRHLIHVLFLIYLVLLFWISMALMAVYLFKMRHESGSTKFQRVKYVLAGTLVGSTSILDFLPSYGINFPPIGFLCMTAYPLVFSYAILKYRLMDVSIAITRTGIFIAVYSLVLGTPFAIAFGWREKLIELMGQNWWTVPLISSTALATAGPFLYLFLQKKTEDRLLRDQRRYQSTLRQASAGMSRIKDLKRLLNLIVYILSRAINLNHCLIYLYDENKREYVLEATRGKEREEQNSFIAENSPFIKYLDKAGVPIVYEEIKQKMHDFSDKKLKEVELKLRELEAEVVVPIATDKSLIAFGILGKKKSKEMYTPDDLAVFAILGNQVALAIENAQFYEESKKTQAQLFQAEKMATIGTMADGLSHQINNRLHALGFIAGDALDSIKLKSKEAEIAPEGIRDLLRDIMGALLKIQDNVRQGGEIVQGLLRYTRKGEEGFGPVDFDKLVDASVEMAQFKIKKDQLSIVKDYLKDIPKIYGNFTQLQEVFFNIIDNSYDAVQQRKAEVDDSNYKGKIKVSTRQTDGFLEINVLDNGIGVKDEDQIKLFTPFFTTKLSSKKGTGLGLYVMRKIVEENHHGRVFMSSEYMVGTLTVIKVPIVKK